MICMLISSCFIRLFSLYSAVFTRSALCWPQIAAGDCGVLICCAWMCEMAQRCTMCCCTLVMGLGLFEVAGVRQVQRGGGGS